MPRVEFKQEEDRSVDRWVFDGWCRVSWGQSRWRRLTTRMRAKLWVMIHDEQAISL
jgi:hypothetical protein